MRVFFIDIGYACFGIESREGVVFVAAPIAEWMIGKRLEEIKPFLISRKAKVIEL